MYYAKSDSVCRYANQSNCRRHLPPICLYAMIDAMNVYLNANDTSVLKFKPKLGESQEPLGEVVKDAVAWLTVDGTSIDHPVMQGKTNDTYINKDPYGNFSLSGSIF